MSVGKLGVDRYSLDLFNSHMQNTMEERARNHYIYHDSCGNFLVLPHDLDFYGKCLWAN